MAPKETKLQLNYPNPFNPSTTINYDLSKDGHVSLKVFDVLGREVASLVNENQTAGRREVRFDASHLSSGIYFCRLQAAGYTGTSKLMLTK